MLKAGIHEDFSGCALHTRGFTAIVESFGVKIAVGRVNSNFSLFLDWIVLNSKLTRY